MSQTPRSRYRFGVVLALAGAALFATSGVTLADTETGQHGHYVFKDDASTFGVNCVYASQGNDTYKLTQLVVKAPSLWWPDTNSGSNREHGTVGWRVFVQVSLPGAYGPWSTTFKTSIQKKTAYEDHPAYDPADKAPLAKWTISFNASAYDSRPNAYVRIEHKAFWYKPAGSTLGSVVHDQFNYQWKYGTTRGSTGACPIHFAVH